MLSWIAKTLFRLAGWRLAGTVPRDLPKALWIVAPHATGWDFVLGLGARATIGMRIGFLGKRELFDSWSGWFFRALGGFPVDRRQHQNIVEAEAAFIRERDRIHIAIAPEGTRGDVAELRTGFYHIARLAGVPLILTGWDYPCKTIFIAEPFYPSGDWLRDRVEIARFYASIQGVRKAWVGKYLGSG
ncbi:MAG: 1-acyl-sn-glycerol-3-phosphate acyltransferase [Sphingobacteriaceae bacterium]|nr:1-acyl-sn-glycerol-3-phosphate acyltransferase [Cytophagaceae bacterium]